VVALGAIAFVVAVFLALREPTMRGRLVGLGASLLVGYLSWAVAGHLLLGGCDA